VVFGLGGRCGLRRDGKRRRTGGVIRDHSGQDGIQTGHRAAYRIRRGGDAGIGNATRVQHPCDLVDVVRQVPGQEPQARQLRCKRRRGPDRLDHGVRRQGAGEEETLHAQLAVGRAGGERLVLGFIQFDLDGVLTASDCPAEAGSAVRRGRDRLAGCLFIHSFPRSLSPTTVTPEDPRARPFPKRKCNQAT
jgi:hypothetical protein